MDVSQGCALSHAHVNNRPSILHFHLNSSLIETENTYGLLDSATLQMDSGIGTINTV